MLRKPRGLNVFKAMPPLIQDYDDNTTYWQSLVDDLKAQIHALQRQEQNLRTGWEYRDLEINHLKEQLAMFKKRANACPCIYSCEQPTEDTKIGGSI